MTPQGPRAAITRQTPRAGGTATGRGLLIPPRAGISSLGTADHSDRRDTEESAFTPEPFAVAAALRVRVDVPAPETTKSPAGNTSAGHGHVVDRGGQAPCVGDIRRENFPPAVKVMVVRSTRGADRQGR